jgi:predicted porin
MKKTLIALATFAAATGALAQSSVTLFGGADLNMRNVTSGTNKFSGMAQDGIYSSRLGFMGTEDLGGGLKANFHFEGAMAPDVGTSGFFSFARKSIIGLSGGFGEVRLGRDYTPMFTVAGIADPFGTNGVGSSYNLANGAVVTNVTTPAATGSAAGEASAFRTRQTASAAGTNAAATLPEASVIADPNAVRLNNSVAFYSPSFNGFTVSGMYGYGSENTNLAKKASTGTSFKLAYANGPLSVAYGNQITKGGLVGYAAAASANSLGSTTPGALSTTTNTCPATNSTTLVDASSLAPAQCQSAAITAQAPTDDQKYTTNFFAASYDLGAAKLSAGYKTDKMTDADLTGTFKSTILGVAAPMGALTLKASYVARTYDGAKVGTQTAIGALYDLSKRTTVYATYSNLKNEANYANTVGSASTSAAALSSKGFEAGVKHSF